MATISIVLKTKQKLTNEEFSVALRVTYLRNRRYYSLNSLTEDKYLSFRCREDQWRTPLPEDNGLGRFKKSVDNYKELNQVLEVKLNLGRNIIKSFEFEKIEFSFEEFEARLKGTAKIEKQRPSLISDYYDEKVLELESLNKIGLAEVFKSTLSSLKAFNPTAKLKDINLKFLESFENWMRHEKSLKDTSISLKMRNLKRIFNLAIEDGLLKQEDYPFGEKKYSINRRLNLKTRKRSVSIDVIKQIKELDFTNAPYLRLAQNIFMFSFYNRGMNFIDIANLKWADIYDNEIHYIRKKTGQAFDVPINEHTLAILNFYKATNHSGGNYTFPIFDHDLHKTEKQRYERKKTALKLVNSKLKEIAKLIGEPDLNLTTYVGRHSYATNLKKSGVSTSIISEALGHQTEVMTQTYLAEFDKGVITGAENKLFDF